ncbi:MAG: hypothetical protein ACYDEV_17855, partial [Acidiferrobacter sp.]
TLGQQVLTDLGLSPTTAAWTYGGFGLVAGAGAGAASALSVADGAGAAADSAAAVTSSAETTTNIFATNPNEAVFWSGKTNGIGGVNVAGDIAQSTGGTTLEQLMASKGIALPAWDASNPAVVEAWQNASLNYAQGASGSVNAVIGSTLRPGSVWETIELPALRANPKVTEINVIYPATKAKTVIFTGAGR